MLYRNSCLLLSRISSQEMAKRDWQQSTGYENAVIVGHDTPAVAKTTRLAPEESPKRLKLTDAPEKDRGSAGHISNQSVVIMDTHMEDLEQKRDDEQVKGLNPGIEELYFYKFF